VQLGQDDTVNREAELVFPAKCRDSLKHGMIADPTVFVHALLWPTGCGFLPRVRLHSLGLSLRLSHSSKWGTDRLSQEARPALERNESVQAKAVEL
jgi:hypothetical protein